MAVDFAAHAAGIRDDLAELYRDLHAHPELSFQEHRTAGLAADRARKSGYDVTVGVGGTGVVAKLVNGDGPTVMLRADMDALPVREQTDLPYASTVVADDGRPVMHACGHDMHVTCLLGALDVLTRHRDGWRGTVLAAFQPAEEVGGGAQAMVDDKLFDRFGKPDIVLGQHVAPIPAGMIAAHPGPALAATDALKVTMFGRGGHGSRPETTCDPVVMAAATVIRLQTVVSREIAASDAAVLTIGAMNAGTAHNVIPDLAELQLNIRTYTPQIRTRVLDAVTRIVKAEALAAGADREPTFETLDTFPVMVNDPDATAKTVAVFRDAFGHDKVLDPGPQSASEDCGIFATSAGVPLCYWLFGGLQPQRVIEAFAAGTFARDIPSNHSPFFAPLVEPSIDVGVAAMTRAALTWLD
jgi:amidohydrolase